jgi:adenosylhomocysteinase
VAVLGYGPVGEGAAKQLRSLGASVSIVEQDITKLAKAYFEGFRPVTVEEALATSDLVLSATGCLLTITGEMLGSHARDGIILGNIGHGQEEIDVEWLWNTCARRDINPHRSAYTLGDGRTVHLLCEGALVNFLAASGNPSRELSLTFTATTLAQIALAEARRGLREALPPGIFPLPPEMEQECGIFNFPELVPKLYRLTEQQREYLGLSFPLEVAERAAAEAL